MAGARIDQLPSHNTYGGLSKNDLLPVRMAVYGKTVHTPIEDVATLITTIQNASAPLSVRIVPYTTSIPFTAAKTVVGAHKLTGATTFTKNTAGAVAGGETWILLTGNGADIPDFSAFKRKAGSPDFMVDNNALNFVKFYYEGSNYWYEIIQETAAQAGATQLQMPPNFQAVRSGSDVLLSWSDVSGESSYDLFTSTTGTGGWTLKDNIPADTTSYTHTGASTSAIYYRLIAKGNGTTTTDSQPASAFVSGVGLVLLPPLPAPNPFTATSISSSQINLSWGNVANNRGYLLLRNTTNSTVGAVQIAALPQNAVSYNNVGLTASTQYFYFLQASGDGLAYENSPFSSANATTQAASVSTFSFDYGWQDTDPFSLISGGGTPTFQRSDSAPVGATISADTRTMPPNRYLFVRYPATEPTKTAWFNTAFNYGDIPDSAFRSVITVGAYKWIITRDLLTMDSSQPTTFS